MSGKILPHSRTATCKYHLRVQPRGGLTAAATVKDYLTVHPGGVCHLAKLGAELSAVMGRVSAMPGELAA